MSNQSLTISITIDSASAAWLASLEDVTPEEYAAALIELEVAGLGGPVPARYGVSREEFILCSQNALEDSRPVAEVVSGRKGLRKRAAIEAVADAFRGAPEG